MPLVKGSTDSGDITISGAAGVSYNCFERHYYVLMLNNKGSPGGGCIIISGAAGLTIGTSCRASCLTSPLKCIEEARPLWEHVCHNMSCYVITGICCWMRPTSGPVVTSSAHCRTIGLRKFPSASLPGERLSVPGTGLVTVGVSTLFGVSAVLREEMREKAFRLNEVTC